MDTAGNFSTTNKASLVYINGAEVVWKKVGGGIDAYGQGIAVDSSGNVYVTGSTYNGENDDYLTIKYNSNGDTVWQKSYDGGYEDRGSGIAVDSSGNVYVIGVSCDSNGGGDYFTIKYNSNGDTVWQKRYDSGNGMNDYGFGIAVDSSGNVYVIGYSDTGTNRDYLTIKYRQY
jgi:hypothetical protein